MDKELSPKELRYIRAVLEPGARGSYSRCFIATELLWGLSTTETNTRWFITLRQIQATANGEQLAPELMAALTAALLTGRKP